MKHMSTRKELDLEPRVKEDLVRRYPIRILASTRSAVKVRAQ